MESCICLLNVIVKMKAQKMRIKNLLIAYGMQQARKDHRLSPKNGRYKLCAIICLH